MQYIQIITGPPGLLVTKPLHKAEKQLQSKGINNALSKGDLPLSSCDMLLIYVDFVPHKKM